MFLDTGKQNILLPEKSNKIMFSDHWEAKRFGSWKSNNIMFSDTRKQNVLLADESNKIMFFRHLEGNCFAS